MSGKRVGVIGLGSVGAFTALELQQRGYEVVGFEAFGVANDLSAVGGDTRLFRRLYREGGAYYHLIERAYELWRELDKRLPTAFRECGALALVPEDSDYARDLEAYANEFNIEHEVLRGDELHRRFPQFTSCEGDVGYYDPCGGFVRTDLVVRDAFDRAEALGAQHIEATVTEVIPHQDGVTIRAEDGNSWEVDRVVVAAGARTTDILPQLAPYTRPRLQVMTWFQPDAPEDFRATEMPVFIREGDGFHAYGAPTLDGLHVKVSGLTEPRDAEFDGIAYDGQATLDDLRDCEATITRVLQDVHPVPVRTAVYPELYAIDRMFILDWLDAGQRVFVASAFSGKGFKMCNAIGELVAKILHDEAELPRAFSLTRFPGWVVE
ncbi:FAD-dependent oxidoreductase [Gulosibacter bifidus]|uniref:FAD-dependent oxidoreductase n=1 Tax=Gulosibacter bifidus TaxID=272239 RepID=A0ABW5RK48_9MICO|nr:FAD-dependent oxidoreductase [Gulosibacter bifidus]